MVKINIEGLTNVNDPFYRYKMEQINILQQKNKTEITNLEIIGVDLRRDPELIVAYIKIKMGISLDYKNGILKTSATLVKSDVQKLLKEFIEQIVLCPVCTLPEISLSISGKKKNKKLEGQCNSCPNNVDYNNTLDDKILKGFMKILEKEDGSKKKLKKSEFDNS